MPVELQHLVIPFTGGIDEEQDAHVVAPPLVSQSTNFASKKKGALSIRDSYANVVTGAPSSNPVMARHRDNLLVVDDETYGVFDTSREEYHEIGQVPGGSRAFSLGVSSTLPGSHHTQVARMVNDDQVAVGYNVTEVDGTLTFHLEVRDRDTGDILFRDDARGSVQLFDACYVDGVGAVFLGWGVGSTQMTTYWVTESSGTFTVTARSYAALTGYASPVRQAAFCPGDSSDVWVILNMMYSLADLTEWGDTMCYRQESDGTVTYHAVVSDGTAGNVDRDGSEMVAIGFDEYDGSPIFATCSIQSGDVYVFTHTGATYTAGTQIANTVETYGVRMTQAAPNATPYIWEPTGASPNNTTAMDTGGFSDSFWDSYDSYGHRFMHGWVEMRSSGNVVVAWHGVATFGQGVAAKIDGATVVNYMNRPKLLGTEVHRLTRSGDTFSAVDSLLIPCSHLLSRPVKKSSTLWDIPVAAASKWLYTVNDPDSPNDAGITTGFVTFRMQLGEHFVADAGLQYLCGAIVAVDFSEMKAATRTLFGQDEVMPHTSPFWLSDMSNYLYGTQAWVTLDDDSDWRIFDVHLSGIAPLDDDNFVVGATRWAQRDIDAMYGETHGAAFPPYDDGQGDIFDWDSFGRQYGPLRETAAMWTRLAPPIPSATAVSDLTMVTSGRPLMFDGTQLFPLDWYIPPQPVLQRESTIWGTRNATSDRTASITAVWVFRDANGTEWRSAPGTTAVWGLKRWSNEVHTNDVVTDHPPDAILAVFDRPLPLPVGMSGRVGIEYYADYPTEYEASANNYDGDGTLRMWAWCDAEGATSYPIPLSPSGLDDPYVIFGLSMGYAITHRNMATRLLYTTGGVLPDEPPVGANGATLAGGRVWYIRDGRAYFSKQVSSRTPLAFNASLYIDSPSGSPLVAVSHMDEYVVVFTEEDVFVCAGEGPNALGSGGSYQPVQVSSDVGCRSPASVVATKHGVFFAGPDTMYLLRRDMEVTRIGNPEDTLDPDSIVFAAHDPSEQRIFWSMGSTVLVFEYDTGMWHTWSGSDISDVVHMAWTPADTYALSTVGTIKKQDSSADHPDATLETGWIHLGQVAGYKRFRNLFVVGGFTEEKLGADLSVSLAFDYDPTPSETMSAEVSGLDPIHEVARFKPANQKCVACKVRITCTDQNAKLSHLGAEVGVKAAGDKTARPDS